MSRIEYVWERVDPTVLHVERVGEAIGCSQADSLDEWRALVWHRTDDGVVGLVEEAVSAAYCGPTFTEGIP